MAGSLDSLLSKCTTLSLPHTKQLHAHLFTTGQFQLPISPSRSKLLELYALSLGNLSFAILAFSQIRTPSTNDWNAIIRGFIQSPNPTNAFAWYKSMISKSRKVDALTCSFVLKACARVLARLESIQIHTHIVRKGFIADALLGTTLLDLYAKVGDIDSAEKVFDEMVKRDIASWNALISGFAQGSKPTEALSLFNRMEIDGFKPNEISVLGALSACAQLGDFKLGEKIHGYIKDERLDMNAQLVEMGSNHCGDFVLLSNVYAARERWADVGRVREAMKNRDVRKVPGLSYIEGNGVIHKFYNADKSHESWREIYAKLDEIRFRTDVRTLIPEMRSEMAPPTDIPIIICRVWKDMEGWILIPDSFAVEVSCNNNTGG
ncbi:hypothetical protein OIU77_019836 [Salix suchowensis]|uniref:Pentatricopeptide repeat-containing protein n=1 Tax=Salix suchowensis TaxID=1278906 RepID=A0ABQ9CHF3_9ROSI|nr:hypothetical protein OIU77_019836 [Salix suchowensis]